MAWDTAAQFNIRRRDLAMDDQHKGLLKTLGLIVALVIGIAIISHPGVRDMQNDDAARICVHNLALIEEAKAHYAVDHDFVDGAPCTMQDLLADGKVFNTAPICPSGGTYTVGALGVTPTCSIGGLHVLPSKRGEAVDENEDLIR